MSVPSATARHAALTGTRIGFQLSEHSLTDARALIQRDAQRRADVNQRVQRDTERAHSRRGTHESDTQMQPMSLASVNEHVLYTCTTVQW